MIRLSVPASTTNFGSGFDAFGLALELRNEFTVKPSDVYRVTVKGYAEGIPADETNLFIKVYKKVCRRLRVKEYPLELEQLNRVPPARGLGSSATAIVAAVETALLLNERELTLEEKLSLAFEFEPHPDNLLPAFTGGFTVACTEGRELKAYARLSFPKELKLYFLVPSYELSTEKARAVLPRSLKLEEAVFNLQRSALLVAALAKKEFGLLREALRDRLHQPYRAPLVPGFTEALKEAEKAGALGAFLSGAGPTVCVVSQKPVSLESVRRVLEEASGDKVELLELKPSDEGVKVF
ncbi:MAG: homoserine kinase [Aquificae bacterium]|nr:homoserine kinase [Aquificota bacterium]